MFTIFPKNLIITYNKVHIIVKEKFFAKLLFSIRFIIVHKVYRVSYCKNSIFRNSVFLGGCMVHVYVCSVCRYSDAGDAGA